jgi:hypothetical protein
MPNPSLERLAGSGRSAQTSAVQVRSATVADAERISSLVRSLGRPFLLSEDGSGAEPFLESIGEQAIRGCISASNFSYRPPPAPTGG